MAFSKKFGFQLGGRTPSAVVRAIDAALTETNGHGRVLEVFTFGYADPAGATFRADNPTIDDVAALTEIPAFLNLRLRTRPGEVEDISVDSYASSDGRLDIRVSARTQAGLEAFFAAFEKAAGVVRSASLIDSLGMAASSFMPGGVEAAASALAVASRVPGADTRTTSEPAVLLVAPLREEREVLEKVLGLRTSVADGVARGVRHGVNLEMISPRRMGRVPSAVATAVHLARSKGTFKLVILIGICGGFAEAKTDRGAVVVANEVVDLASRKITKDTEFRPVVYSVSDVITRFVDSAAFSQREWADAVTKADTWPAGRHPFVTHGPIACADEIVASDEWRKRLVGEWAKVAGIETEAAGVCAAAEEFGLKVAVIRGVSDLADANKQDDDWRRLAMGAAVQLLDAFLASGIPSVRSG